MYIRWKKRMSQSKQKRAHYTLDTDENGGLRWRPKTEDEKSCLMSVYLVKSVRVNGKPRQQATFLASIQRTDLDSTSRRVGFWHDVRKKLEPLHLPEEQLITIKQKLLEQVPDVTKEQIEQENKKWAEWMAGTKRLLGQA